MTREEKAIAAFGSVIAVSVLFALVWSIPIALLTLVVGLAVTVAVLRLTHPKGKGRPALRQPPPPTPPTLPPPPLSEQERVAQQAELDRRRREAEERTAAREAEREERARAAREAKAKRDEERAAAKAAKVERRRAEADRKEAEARAREEAEARAREGAEAGAREEAELRAAEEARIAALQAAWRREAERRRTERELEPPHPSSEAALDGPLVPVDEDVTDHAGILAASERAELTGRDETADETGDEDERRQRTYLLNKVRLRLSDYE